MAYVYTTPPFTGLPPVEGHSDCRWVASTIMSSEQYRVEGWERAIVGHIEYWRARQSGLVEFAALSEERRRIDAHRVEWEAVPLEYDVDETLWRGA